ncbi:TetR/AcrR family transcriptional regulator [Streptomyces chartreusis]|uniref:TetR/AcrR family transcriptional regulator n=1 Tax=Streptomyces chartreusis TaxID=1969 RepID=UPI00340446D0
MDPRIGRTREQVLSQAMQLLATAGPDAVTYSELAVRAQVARQTLYRHWPTRERLFEDLVRENRYLSSPRRLQVSGSSQEIILSFMAALRSVVQDQANAAVLITLVAQAVYDRTSGALLTELMGKHRANLNDMLESSGVTISSDDFDLLCAPVIYQRFFSGMPASDEFVKCLVDRFLATEEGI